jgi:5-methylcytosine-specific restriction endonuclease McrA
VNKNALYYAANRTHILATKQVYLAANRDARNARENARRQKIKMATPSWLTKVERAAMRLMYANASLIGGAHVDHIVPINNPFVCGLHVPWNLRIVSATENLKKYALHTP